MIGVNKRYDGAASALCPNHPTNNITNKNQINNTRN